MDTIYDTVIIGGGAAGLSAAQMLGRSRRRTLVIDGGQPRNRFAAHTHGILGHDGTPPGEALLSRGREELVAYAVEVRSGHVTSVEDHGDTLTVVMPADAVLARSVILAAGITDHLPDIAGLAERWGRSVIHCPYCHGWEVRDQRIGVLVAAPGHVHLAFMARQLSEHVTVFVQEPGLIEDTDRDRLAARGITIVDSPVTALRGPGSELHDVDTEDGRSHGIDALFAGGWPVPHDDALAALDLERTEISGASVIATEPDGSTSHSRIWAAGNVVNPMANVPMAASAGTLVGARVNAFLVVEDFDRAVGTQRVD